MTRRALVVGAASGMGLATARLLKARGHDLLLADVSQDALAPLARELDAPAFPLDLADAGAARRLGAWLDTPIDALVVTAGIGPSMGDFARILAINLAGTAAVVDACADRMRAGGAIVCLSSMTAHSAPVSDPAILALLDCPERADLADALARTVGPEKALPGMGYALSKAGILRLVQRLASVLGARGVRICSVSPGCIDTPMGALEMSRSAASRAALQSAPLPRSGTAEEVARAIAFLVFDGGQLHHGLRPAHRWRVDGRACQRRRKQSAGEGARSRSGKTLTTAPAAFGTDRHRRCARIGRALCGPSEIRTCLASNGLHTGDSRSRRQNGHPEDDG